MVWFQAWYLIHQGENIGLVLDVVHGVLSNRLIVQLSCPTPNSRDF